MSNQQLLAAERAAKLRLDAMQARTMRIIRLHGAGDIKRLEKQGTEARERTAIGAWIEARDALRRAESSAKVAA